MYNSYSAVVAVDNSRWILAFQKNFIKAFNIEWLKEAE